MSQLRFFSRIVAGNPKVFDFIRYWNKILASCLYLPRAWRFPGIAFRSEEQVAFCLISKQVGCRIRDWRGERSHSQRRQEQIERLIRSGISALQEQFYLVYENLSTTEQQRKSARP